MDTSEWSRPQILAITKIVIIWWLTQSENVLANNLFAEKCSFGQSESICELVSSLPNSLDRSEKIKSVSGWSHKTDGGRGGWLLLRSYSSVVRVLSWDVASILFPA